MHADALATVLTVLGPDDGIAFARRQNIAALFVEKDGDDHLAHPSDSWTAQIHAT